MINLPRTLNEDHVWIMVPSSEEDDDQLAVLNPESRFMLYPIVEGDDGLYYQPQNGWLEVSIAAFDCESDTIKFRVQENSLPGVTLMERKVARGTIETVDHNFLRLTVHGLRFDNQTPVDWISFEESEK
jgi:hypothetical protein